MPFGPWASFEECVAEMRAEYDEETARKVCATLHHKITGEWPGASKSEPAVRGQVGGPIVWKNARKQVAFGVVLVPGEPDVDGDIVTKEQVEDYAHGYLEQFRLIDKQHSLEALDAHPVESYTTPVEITVSVKGQEVTLPKGTWIMGTKVRDKAVWKQIENGELEGYSIMGVSRKDFEAAMKSWPGVAAKSLPPAFRRVTMDELGMDDIMVPFVSLCKGPAVPKAMFFALKSHEAQAESEGWWSKVKGLVTAKEGKVLSAANRKRLEEARSVLDEVLRTAGEEDTEMDKMEILEVVSKAVADAIQPLSARMDELETAAKDAEQPPEVPPVDPVADEVGQMKARIAELETANKAKADELETFQKDVQERIKTLTAKSRVQPRGEDGQDGDSSEPQRVAAKDRDILGRKLSLGGRR